MIDILIHKMERRDHLSEAEKHMMRQLPVTRRRVPAGQIIVQEGDRQEVSLLLASGFTGRFGLLREGERQFTQLGVPGDFMDLHSLLLKRMDHSVATLSACELGAIPHGNLRDLTESDPHLARLLWLETVVDAAIHRTWLVGLGRRDALARTAHLLCEARVRLEAVGLSDEGRFDLPLSQREMADMVGISTVHMNRTVQALRARGLIDWEGGCVSILDWDRLSKLAEFDPLYLRLWQEPV